MQVVPSRGRCPQTALLPRVKDNGITTADSNEVLAARRETVFDGTSVNSWKVASAWSLVQ